MPPLPRPCQEAEQARRPDVWPVDGTCARCGANFLIWRRRWQTVQRFCSRACGAGTPLGVVTCAAPACSARFRQRRRTHRFCSNACRGAVIGRGRMPREDLRVLATRRRTA